MTLVFFVIFLFRETKSILKLSLSTSTKTTLAPVKETAFAVAKKVMFGTITSSPFLTPIAFKAKNNAIVPLVVEIAYFILKIFFTLSSIF